jgi:hypothetical protein
MVIELTGALAPFSYLIALKDWIQICYLILWKIPSMEIKVKKKAINEISLGKKAGRLFFSSA